MNQITFSFSSCFSFLHSAPFKSSLANHIIIALLKSLNRDQVVVAFRLYRFEHVTLPIKECLNEYSGDKGNIANWFSSPWFKERDITLNCITRHGLFHE